MADHPNALLLRRAAEAFAKEDMNALGNIIDEECTWHIPGKGLLGGNYKGHSQIFSFFGKLMKLSGNTLKVDLHDAVSNDQHAVILHRLMASRPGKTMDINVVVVAHIREAKIYEAWDSFSDQYAWDEFWE